MDGPVNDRIEGTALSYANDLVDIYSASWGPNDDGKTLDGPGRLAREALERGVREVIKPLGNHLLPPHLASCRVEAVRDPSTFGLPGMEVIGTTTAIAMVIWRVLTRFLSAVLPKEESFLGMEKHALPPWLLHTPRERIKTK